LEAKNLKEEKMKKFIRALLVLSVFVSAIPVLANDTVEVVALLEVFNPADKTSYFIIDLNPVDGFESMVERAKKSSGIKKVIIVRPSFVYFNNEFNTITVVPVNIE
jgi:thioredoxin-related protein